MPAKPEDQSLESFCDEWLNVWTGNRPDDLAAFYHPETFYRDPVLKKGIHTRKRLHSYLKKLLSKNPDWVWTREELFQTRTGFTLKWKAQIPAGDATITEYGLDIVELQDGLIIRNEVYFDRSALLRQGR